MEKKVLNKDEKTSKLTLQLKASTGMSSKEIHKISLNQWIDIQKILNK